MIIPVLNSKGKFTFKEPYNSLVKKNQIFTVASIRSLKELEDSGEKPFDTIYASIGLTETEFKDDIIKNIPIVVFKTDGGEHFYVPADRITSEPLVVGVKYQKTGIVAELGYVPIDLDLDMIKGLITEAIYSTTSITPMINTLPISSVIAVDKTEDTQFRKLMESKKTVDKSYKTKYQELLKLYEEKDAICKKLEAEVIKKG